MNSHSEDDDDDDALLMDFPVKGGSLTSFRSLNAFKGGAFLVLDEAHIYKWVFMKLLF